MRRILLGLSWAAGWPVAAFLLIGVALIGDPAEGAVETKRWFAWSLLATATMIYALGYWLLFRKRVR